MNVSELAVGVSLNKLPLLIEKSSIAMTKKNTPYLRATFRDQTGSIEGIWWDYSPSLEDVVREGRVVEVTGRVSSYNGGLQLAVEDLMSSTKTAQDYARWTKMDVEKIWSDLVDIIGEMKEPLTKFVSEELLLKQQTMIDGFKKAPAAKSVHNNWFGGLLEHVWSLCQIAKPVVAHYQKNYLEKISLDKVLFGLIFHDAGKIIEYDYESPAFSFTNIGTFTNHLVLGPAWVYEKANAWWKATGAATMNPDKFKIERAHLMHVLAAHHGQLEWGSPVKPSSIEALLVHHLDNLDSKVLHAYDLVVGKTGPIAGFSEQSRFERVPYFNYPS